MSDEPRCVILFRSTTHVVRAEKVLLAAGLKPKLIPVPRELSSECGVCLMVACGDQARAVTALKAAAVAYEGVHTVRRF